MVEVSSRKESETCDREAKARFPLLNHVPGGQGSPLNHPVVVTLPLGYILRWLH